MEADDDARTLITDGTVVSPSGRIAGRRADRRRDDRRGPGPRAGRRRSGSPPTRPIDATGKYVIPGGIDVHTHMELPFGGTESSRHVRDRHDRRGVGRRHDHRRLRRAEHRRQRAGRPRRVAREGRRQLRHRLRLPPDHRRRRRGVAQGDDVPHRQRGHHQLQAVHGLPGRLLLRRRPDPAGDADGRRVRGDDHDARRERHRHRRARRPGARPRRDRPEVPLAAPGRPSSRARPPTGRSCWPRSPATCRCTSCTCRRREALEEVAAARHAGAQRVRRDLPAVPLPDARGPARPARLRGRQVGLLDAAAHEARAPPAPTSGRACG